MNKTLHLKHSFNWRMLLMRILVNMLALSITALVIPQIYFVSRSLIAWILMALGLGILNALVKPIIQFLTLRFIFVTVGLVLVVINAIMLYLLSWLMPNQFAVDSLLWAAVGGLVLGIVSAFFENLLGLTPPIVSEKYPEIRQQVQDRQFYRTRSPYTQVGAIETMTPPTHTLAADGELAVETGAAQPEA